MLAVSVQYMQAKEQERHNLNQEILASKELEQKRRELQFQKDKFVQEHELNLIMSQYTVASKMKELQISETNAKANIAKAEADFMKAQASMASANASLVSAQAAMANAAINADALRFKQQVEYPTNVQLQNKANQTNVIGNMLGALGRVGSAIVGSISKSSSTSSNTNLAQTRYNLTQNIIQNQNRFYN